MLTFVAGIAVGAAFSPFWLKVWTVGKAWVVGLKK
jgi:hypothetical protein